MRGMVTFRSAGNPKGYQVEMLTLNGVRLPAEIFRLERWAARKLAEGYSLDEVVAEICSSFERISADFRVRVRTPRGTENRYCVSQ